MTHKNPHPPKAAEKAKAAEKEPEIKPVLPTDEKKDDKEDKAEGVLDDFFGRFVPAEAQPILDIFKPPFTTGKLWAFMSAAAKLGPTVEAFLHRNFAMSGGAESGPPTGPVDVSFTAHIAAHMPSDDVTTAELCDQYKAACDACPTLAQQGKDGEPAVAMNPVLAGLLAALIKRGAAELLRRLSGG